MKITEERIFIPLGDGKLAAIVHLPSSTPAHLVICSHGLLSSKESSKFKAIAEAFAAEGLGAIRFDFTGCGETTTKWLRSLLETRIRDLEAVMDYALKQGWTTGTIGLLGSSLGGYLSLIMAAKKTESVKATVCWATPFELRRVAHTLKQTDTVAGVKFPPNCEVGSPIDLTQLPPVRGVMVIHGQKDELVPWSEAVEIYKRLGEPCQLVLMEEVEHRFLDPYWRQHAIRKSLAWFKEQLFG